MLLTVSSVLPARIGAQSMNISLPILCESQRNKRTIETQTLIDSGAREDFLLHFSLYYTFTPLLLHPFYHYLITLLQGHMAIHAVAL